MQTEILWFGASATALVCFGMLAAWIDRWSAYPAAPEHEIATVAAVSIVAVTIALAVSASTIFGSKTAR